MLVHSVTITFTESTTVDQIGALHGALAALPSEIDVIGRTRHGRDLGDRPMNAHYGIVSEFDSAEDFRTYLEHPAHRAIVQDHLLPLAASWHSVQFPAGAEESTFEQV